MCYITVTIELFGYKVPVSVPCTPQTPMEELVQTAYKMLRLEATISKAKAIKEMRK